MKDIVRLLDEKLFDIGVTEEADEEPYIGNTEEDPG